MSDEETKQLLREIRDLQKAYYDRYVQFTEQIMEAERQAAAANAKREQENEAYFQRSAAHQQEMRDVIKRNQRHMLIAPFVLFGILAGIAVLYVLGSMMLSALPMP